MKCRNIYPLGPLAYLDILCVFLLKLLFHDGDKQLCWLCGYERKWQMGFFLCCCSCDVRSTSMPAFLELCAIDNRGKVFRLSTNETHWQENRYVGLEFKRLSTCSRCTWAIGSDHQVYLYVNYSDVPIRVKEKAYENQARLFHCLIKKKLRNRSRWLLWFFLIIACIFKRGGAVSQGNCNWKNSFYDIAFAAMESVRRFLRPAAAIRQTVMEQRLRYRAAVQGSDLSAQFQLAVGKPVVPGE